MQIVYEEKTFLVCLKPAGVLSQAGAGENMPALLRGAVGGEIFPVHRLDTPASGLMVFAKTAAAAAALSRQVSAGDTEKEYFCVTHGTPENDGGTLTDLLFKDSRKNKSYVVVRPRRGVKEARLSYTLLGATAREGSPYSLMRIKLDTGRTHQIRVQFASRRMPLAGDGKYGAADNFHTLALWSCRLGFLHPESGEPLSFFVPPPSEAPWNWFPPDAYAFAEN
ncbi:MAG: RluA family pseudouridine synthase [Clostridia bacterium]|nr:RluA family pseudouridine synthase [Clostridia bacterium]